MRLIQLRLMADCMRDALTGLGHACGHNLIAAASVGAALAEGGSTFINEEEGS